MRSSPALPRKSLLLLGLLVLLWVSALSHPEAVSAHPLGNFTINRYTRIELPDSQIFLQYVLDMAEIPTFQEMARIDLDRRGGQQPGECCLPGKQGIETDGRPLSDRRRLANFVEHRDPGVELSTGPGRPRHATP